jgi:four helix bundle protein
MAGARHHSELIAWQLADQLRVQTLTLTARPRFVKDLKLHSQTEDAVNAVCRNVAEGFGCESHIEFARFLKISRRSLNEVQDAFRSAQLKGYVDGADLKAIAALMRRLYPALSKLIAYLESTPDYGRRGTRRTSRTLRTPRTSRTPRTPRTDK